MCGKCKVERPLTDFHRDKTHKDGRVTTCSECRSAYSREHHAKNRGEINKRMREYAKGHRGGYTERQKKWRLKNPKKHKSQVLKMEYGITLENYIKLLELQGGGCGICKKLPDSEEPYLAVDHNHATQKVRGILCRNCNLGVGYFKDNIELLTSAAIYLKVVKDALG